MGRFIDNLQFSHAQRSLVHSARRAHTPLKYILISLLITFAVVDTGLILAFHGIRPRAIAPYPYLMNLATCGVALYMLLVNLFAAMSVGQAIFLAGLVKEGDQAKLVTYLRETAIPRIAHRTPIDQMIHYWSRATMHVFLVGLAFDGWIVSLIYFLLLLLVNWAFTQQYRNTVTEEILKLTDEQVNVQ